MALLSGNKIKKDVEDGKIMIDPFNHEQCNSSSYDYRLGPVLKILDFNNVHENGTPFVDPRLEMKYEEVTIPKSGYLLEPGRAYLGATIEKLGSKFYPSMVTGKSSIGRLFIQNHVCAGFIDPGFYNHVTLEITAQLPTLIFPGMRFGQICWMESVGELELYKGKYNEVSSSATPSRIHLDWDK